MGVAAGTQMASGTLGTATGIYNLIRGAKEQAAAKRAMNEYERQKLTNVADGLQVSTLGSDLQREEQMRLAASQNQMLADSGTRGIVGGIGKVEAGNQKVMQQTAADLDEQQRKIEMMQAEDNARIRTMQEARENADLAALSSQFQSGKMDANLGMGNIIQGVGQLGHGYAMTSDSSLKPQASNYNTGYPSGPPQAPPGMYLSTYGTTTPYNYPATTQPGKQ